MQKLILVKGNDTNELDKLLNDGYYIKDFKPMCESASASVSCGGEYYSYQSGHIRGYVYAYVLLERNPKILNEKCK